MIDQRRMTLRTLLGGLGLAAAMLAGSVSPAAAFHEGVHTAELSGDGVSGVAVIKCVYEVGLSQFVCHEEVNVVGLAPGTYNFFIDNTFICSFTVAEDSTSRGGCMGDVLLFSARTATITDAQGNVVASGPFEFHGP